MPRSARRCMESWQKYLPEYEIRRWDESNFDVDAIPYTRDAYRAKKYAFVSDYARFKILHDCGGLYFDTDVEVIRPLGDIIEAGTFMGCESKYVPGCQAGSLNVNPGLGMGAEAGNELFRRILEKYGELDFELNSGSAEPVTVVRHTTDCLCEAGLRATGEIQRVAGINIYPAEYFCPISTVDGKLQLTENTRSIHHYDQSWQSPLRKYGRRIILRCGGVRLKEAIKKFLYK